MLRPSRLRVRAVAVAALGAACFFRNRPEPPLWRSRVPSAVGQGHSQPFPADVHLVIAPPRNRVASRDAPPYSISGIASEDSLLNPPSVLSTSAQARAMSPLLGTRPPSHAVAPLTPEPSSGSPLEAALTSTGSMHDTWLHLAMPPLAQPAEEPSPDAQGAATPQLGGRPKRDGGAVKATKRSKRGKPGSGSTGAAGRSSDGTSRDDHPRTSATGSYSECTSVSFVGSVSVGPLEAATANAAKEAEASAKQWSAWGDHLSAKTVAAAVKAAPVWHGEAMHVQVVAPQRSTAAGSTSEGTTVSGEARGRWSRSGSGNSGTSGTIGAPRGLDRLSMVGQHTETDDTVSGEADEVPGVVSHAATLGTVCCAGCGGCVRRHTARVATGYRLRYGALKWADFIRGCCKQRC